MLTVTRALVLFVCFVLLANKEVQGQDLVNINHSVIGTAGGNEIWYQSDKEQVEFMKWGNILNPVQISIVYNSGSSINNATVCVNSFAQTFPISGINLNSTCPNGAVGIVSNATQIILPAADSNATSETFFDFVYVKPTTEGGFVVVIPENNVTQKFEVSINAMQCNNTDYYPVGSGDNICEPIPSIDVNSERIVSLAVGEWKYFQLDTGILTNDTNTLYAYSNNSESIKIYTQSGYYPTASWYLPTYDEELSDNIARSSLLTPGIFNQSETYFFGITNIGDSSTSITFNITSSSCNSFTNFGLDCAHLDSNNVDASIGVYLISATLSSPNATNATTNNVGSAFSFDFDDDSDYDGDYAYFTINEYPIYDTPYYIRISAANNDVTDQNGAPPLFVKRGGYPSAQSNHYNVSTTGDVTHQVLIKIDAEDLASPLEPETTWYFAVALPADFSVWVGANCAGNCDNQAFGVCMCDSLTCQNATSNFQDPSAFYQRPRSLLDSAGSCECVDDDYDSSFNCSEVNYPNFWIWITLISIIAAIVLVIAIGVPILCYLTNRKKHDSFEAIE